MLKRIFPTALFAGLAFAAAQAQMPDVIGLSALRAVTTNLNGAGIRVAHPEANLNVGGAPYTFEVSPSNGAGQPTNLFTYFSLAGTATGFTNAVGAESWHANSVAGVFYGIAAGVATNVAHVDNFDADFFINAYVVSNLAVLNDPIVNQSFVDTDTNSQSDYDAAYDDYAAQHQTLFISGAGNGGRVLPPSTCFNGISVSAYYDGTNYGGVGPTPAGGRCKPDLTALGGYTSVTTPQVSGAAALLMQAALRGDGGSDTNSANNILTIKALLLNGAVKPPGWTNSNSAPLDARYGAGMVNVMNSYEQLAGGKQGSIISNIVAISGAHPPIASTNNLLGLVGWDFSTNTSSIYSAAVQHYFVNLTNSAASAKFSAKATLVWNRHFNTNDINNLNLFLYNCANSNLVACSTSLVDNVEHIYQTNLALGRYDLQVWKAGGLTVTTDETYALAFEFVPLPVLAISGGANPALQWPLYPAGFLVEARTNLLSGAWSANEFSFPGITNGLNNSPLNTTNGAQFFRLRSPNF